VNRLDTYYVDTYTVVMNVTLSIDDELVRRARRIAAAMDKSLNQVIRDHLVSLTSHDGPESFGEELRRLSAAAGGRSSGTPFTRDDAHARS